MLSICLAFLIGPAVLADGPSLDPKAATPPQARRIPKTTIIHGETRVDDYFWLREKTNPEVIAYLEAENAYTAAVDEADRGAARRRSTRRCSGASRRPTSTSPTAAAADFYYSRTEQGKQYPIYCRKRRSRARPRRSCSTSTSWPGARSSSRSGRSSVSDDGNLLAYTTDITGFRDYTLQVKDLRTGALLPDRIERVRPSSPGRPTTRRSSTSPRTPAKRPTSSAATSSATRHDALVYEEKDELFGIDVGPHRATAAYLFFASSSADDHRDAAYLPRRPAAATPPRDRRPARTSTSTTSTIATASSTSAPTRAAHELPRRHRARGRPVRREPGRS